MSRYPEDLLVDATKAAAHEQARLEAQKKASKKATFGTALGDPKDNPVYTIDATAVVTPALVQQSHEVIARHAANTALAYPTGDKAGAEANIATVQEAFGFVSRIT